MAAISAPMPCEADPEALQAGQGARPSPSRAEGPFRASARTRERPRPAPCPSPRISREEAQAAEEEDREDARIERMRIALQMEFEGKTHAQIAAHFGRCVRTIRYWLHEARAQRLVTFTSTSAEDLLAEMEERICARETIAWRLMNAALEAKEDRRADLWMRRIAELEQQRLALHERTGAFDALREDRKAEREWRGRSNIAEDDDQGLRSKGVDPEEFRATMQAMERSGAFDDWG